MSNYSVENLEDLLELIKYQLWIKENHDVYINNVDLGKEKLNKVGIIEKNTIDRIQNDIIISYIESGIVGEDFLSKVSYESRTALNMILSTVQLMLNQIDIGGGSIEIYKDHLKSLKKNSYKLLRLIDNSLEVVKIKNNMETVSLNNCNIVQVIENIVEASAPYFEEYGRSIIFDTKEEEVLLACDVEKVESVILNLLSNAVKFSDEGSTIEINVKTNSEKSNVFISVKDYTKNVDKRFVNKILKGYEKQEDIYTKNNDGSGLGLFIAKRIIEMHCGEMWVNNSNEGVIEFNFYIPINNLEDNKSVQPYIEKNSKVERCTIEFLGI